jgi:AraC-like DNA-binding protein
LFQLLIKEYEECNNFPVLEGILKILLAKTLQVAQPALSQTKIFSSNLFQAYRELLTQSNHIQNNVAHYAALLNTTPQNLNAICRRQVNLSAAAVLAEHLINEAKRLLLYTDNTIATISFTLNFKDPSHFVKYFKRFTGETPQLFRKNN